MSNNLIGQVVFPSMESLASASWVGVGQTIIVKDYYTGLPDDREFEFRVETGLIADGLTIISLGNANFARLLNKNLEGYTLQELGLVKEALELKYPSLFYDSLSSIRKRNIDSLNSIAAKDINIIVDGLYELQPTDSDGIQLGDGIKKRIIGLGREKSILDFFPKHGRVGQLYDFITLGDRNFFEMEKVKIVFPRVRFETYNATLKVSGDGTKVQISDALLRTGFTPQNGDTLYSVYNNQILAEQDIVSAYDSGTKTITLTGSLEGALPSDQTGYVSFHFPDSLSLDTVKQYGKYWYDQRFNSRGIVYEHGGGFSDTLRILLDDVHIEGFETCVVRSGGNAKLEYINSYFEGHITAITSFNNDYPLVNELKMINCDVARTGFQSLGSMPPESNTSAGGVHAGGVYTHPNARDIFDGCRFYDNAGATVRQFSSSGDKITSPSSEGSVFINCQWWNNNEFNLMCSQSVPTLVTNCIMHGSGLRPGLQTTISNCKLFGVSINYNASNEPGELKGTIYTEINDSDLKYCTISTGWNDKDSSQIIRLNNCIYEPDTSDISISSGTSQPIRRLEFNNCFIGNYSGNHVTNTKGVFASADIAYDLIFNDSDIDTGLYRLFHRTAIANGNWDLYNIEFNNCNVKESLGVDHPQSIGGLLKGRGSVFTDGVIGSAGNNKFSQREGHGGFIDTATINSIPKTLQFPWESNYFLAKDSVTRIIVGAGNGDNRNWTGIFYLEAEGGDIIYSDYGEDINSNFLNSGTITHGEVATFYHRSDTVLAGGTSSTLAQVLFTGDGVDTEFDRYSGSILDGNIVPGTVRIVAGSVIFVDSKKDGKLYPLVAGSGYGFVDYKTRRIYLFYTTAVANGTDITADFDYYTTVHHQGCIIRIK